MSTVRLIHFLQLIFVVGAFTVNRHPLQINTGLGAAPSSVEELISMPDVWGPIKAELDHVPVFSTANSQGQPLSYTVGSSSVGLFFCDIDAAKAELEKAKTETKMEGLQILPFPLGEIFEMGGKKMAAIIPGAAALEAAGAPKDINPVGQQVPLFGCMEIQADFDGTSKTPLFFTYQEAEDAMNMALQGAEEGEQKFEVTVMPLVRAVQTMATNKDKSYILDIKDGKVNQQKQSWSPLKSKALSSD